jgi:hypothetical protein
MARAGTIVEKINDFTYEAGAMKLPAKRIPNQYKNKNMRVVSNKKKPRKSAHKKIQRSSTPAHLSSPRERSERSSTKPIATQLHTAHHNSSNL